MYREICDYCGAAWPRHQITITRRPNDETVRIEICDSCLADIERYIEKIKGQVKP